MKEVRIETKLQNKGHYVPGMISNGMLYISGQLSLDQDTGKVAEGDIRAHMRQALGNMDAVLRVKNCLYAHYCGPMSQSQLAASKLQITQIKARLKRSLLAGRVYQL